MGNAYNAVDDWILFDTYNLSIINEHINQLKFSFENFTTEIKGDKSENGNTTKDVVSKMESLTQTLEDLYVAIITPPLIRTETIQHKTFTKKHIRSKRGLINALGRVNKWFTGVLDDEDEVKFTEEIEDLKRNSNKWKTMALDNVKLVSDTLTEVKEKTRQFQQVQENFAKEVKSMRNYYSQGRLIRIFEQFVLQYNLIHSSLQIIQDTIFLAPIRVNPALIQPQRMFSILSEIQLPSNRRFPLNISDSHFTTFLSLCKLETTIKFSTVIFIITIPILDTRDYKIYENHILPIRHLGSFSTFITNIEKHLLIDGNKTIYKPFSDISKCLKLWNSRYLCFFHNFRTHADTCEFQIFMNMNGTNCQSCSLPVSYEVWEHLDDNQWIFASIHPLKAELHQLDGTIIPLLLPLFGILTVPFQCSVKTPNHIFEGHSRYNVTLNHVIGNFSTFVSTSIETSNVTYEMINFDLSTLNDLQKRWATEKANIKAVQDLETTNWFIRLVHYMGIIQSIVIFSVMVLIGYKVYRWISPRDILPQQLLPALGSSGVNLFMSPPRTFPQVHPTRMTSSIKMGELPELPEKRLTLQPLDETDEEDTIEPKNDELNASSSSALPIQPSKSEKVEKPDKHVTFQRNKSGRFSMKSPFQLF